MSIPPLRCLRAVPDGCAAALVSPGAAVSATGTQRQQSTVEKGSTGHEIDLLGLLQPFYPLIIP